MNRTLWKLDHIGERLWTHAALTATQSASLTGEGKGLAVVADETRNLANKINNVVEKAMWEDVDIGKKELTELALQLNLLALNCAIESSRIIGAKGKPAAVCADDIRTLATEIICLFDEAAAAKKKHTVSPWAANPSSAAKTDEFLLLNAGGINFVEPLVNIKEVCCNMERKNGSIMLRSMELPLVDSYKILGETEEEPTYVIVYTPWAEQIKTYAIAAQASCLFYSPIGKPVDVPADMPLSQYVRECWENENGEPFYFMDWTKMV